jgi:hypothetical protein
MNIGFYKRPRLGTVFTTFYFAGILISASLLSKTALWIASPTFFIGVLAIYFTARSREEVVVYLEKKKEDVAGIVAARDSQLDDEEIKKIVGDPQLMLNEICKRLDAGQGAIYIEERDELKLKYGYAVPNIQVSYKINEGLVGRVAAERKTLYLDKIPEGYITVFSGIGNASPTRLALIPIEEGVIEIATFKDINESTLKHIEELCSGILK